MAETIKVRKKNPLDEEEPSIETETADPIGDGVDRSKSKKGVPKGGVVPKDTSKEVPDISTVQSPATDTVSPETRTAINDSIIKALTTTSQNPAARAEALLEDRIANRPRAKSRSEYDRQMKKLREATYAETGATDPLNRTRPGSYTDADLKRTGANQMGYDWSKTDDPLRGSRLGRNAIESPAATPLSQPATSNAVGESPAAKPLGGGLGGVKKAREDRMASFTPRPSGAGLTTSIQSSDGRVLAKRGEGEAVVAKGGLQGAMGGTEDRPGALTLTQAGESAIRDRLTVQETSAPTDKPLSGSRVVTGRYGTAIGGTRVLDKMKNDGTVPKDFNTTSITEKATVDAIARPPLQSAGELTTREVTRTVGQAPLPEKYAEGRNKLLAGAGQTAKSQGSVVGDAKPLLGRMAPGTGEAVDRKYDKIAADLKQQQEDKLGSDFLTAYKNSGGKVNAPKPGAPSPGPRTDQEKTDMQAFLAKKKEDDLKRRLMAKNSPTL